MSDQLLPTPQAHDQAKGQAKRYKRHGTKHGDANLNNYIAHLSEHTDEPAFPWGPYAAAIERWEAIHGTAPHPVDERNQLDPDFVGWMMGFPPGWNQECSRTQRLKQFGNAVVPHQAILALSMLIDETTKEEA